MKSLFAQRVEEVGRSLEARAEAPSSSRTVALCLPRLLVVKRGNGHEEVAAIVQGELAPLVVGGLEALRVLQAAADLLTDHLVAESTAGSNEARESLYRETREALVLIEKLTAGVDQAFEAASAEHTAFHVKQSKHLPPGENLQ